MTELMKELDEILHTDKEGNGTYEHQCIMCGNTFFGDKHKTICKRCILKSELSPKLQPVTVPQFVVNEYNQLKLENIALKARVAELEKENERLSGIVHNLDHRLITNGEWSKV